MHKQLAELDPEGALLPQKLDRALVDGRKRFDEALETLVAAKAKEALIATEKQDIAAAAEELAKNCVTAAVKHGGADGKEQKGGGSGGPARVESADGPGTRSCNSGPTPPSWQIS